MKTESEIRGKKWVVLLGLALLFIALAFVADTFGASWINAHASPALKHLGVIVSRIGDWPAHVAAGLLGAAIAFFAQRKDWVRIFLVMLIACALAGIAARVIKIAAGRARPTVKTETVWNGPRLSANYNAFPSGHTASSTAFFVPLFLVRRKIGAPFLAIPLVIAAARLVSGAHYLSDVAFAAILGIFCAALTCRVMLGPSQSLNHSTSQPGCQPSRPS